MYNGLLPHHPELSTKGDFIEAEVSNVLRHCVQRPVADQWKS